MYFPLFLIKQFVSVFVIIIPLFSSLLLKAQTDTGCQVMDNKKAIQLYKKAQDMQKYTKQERMVFLKQVLDMEPDYLDANFTYAEELMKDEGYENTSFAPAVVYYQKVLQLCPHYHSDPYYFIGFNYYDEEKYADAITYLQKFLDFKDDDEKKFSKKYDTYLYQAKQMIKWSKFFINIYKNPVPFDPYPVKGLSSKWDEYLACISPDNRYAFFTRKLPYNTINELTNPDNDPLKEYFMRSERGSDGEFNAGNKMPSPPFNKGRNEGGPSITIDDNTLYFTICKGDQGGPLNCDIYFCNAQNGEWGDITNMGPSVNDPDAWDSQPSISADGLTLYFASDRKGGYGRVDIWTTTKDIKSGEWGAAVNLGPTINTPGDDKSPFIHSDSHTLYFSSNGRMGLGGYDIFYSRADSTGKWGEPKNIGYPINSTGDDLGFFVSTDGKTGYFCSNDPNRVSNRGLGGYDIFQFGLYNEARPKSVKFVEGSIKTPEGSPMQGVTTTITNARTKEQVKLMNDTVNGSFKAIVSAEKTDEYIVTANKKGMTFASTTITNKDTITPVKPPSFNIEMKEVAVGSNYTLNNIYYRTNSAQLEPISIAVIDEFTKFLKDNPTIKIKIMGYTDNVGNDNDNLALSKDRAFTVMQTLQQDGITPDRLSFEGMGAANPVASNATEEGRQKNRRTEFIITQK
jgi:outer membrane protein OmpA-like peptidoglycan-associated protein